MAAFRIHQFPQRPRQRSLRFHVVWIGCDLFAKVRNGVLLGNQAIGPHPAAASLTVLHQASLLRGHCECVAGQQRADGLVSRFDLATPRANNAVAGLKRASDVRHEQRD
jgi:hypothetical protein